MFDDTVATEPGKLHRGFLTDHQGRRIYFPTVGPARWVSSPEQEKAFRERVFAWTVVSALPAIAILIVVIIATSGGTGATQVAFIPIGVRLLAECFLARRWPLMDDASITYTRALAQRSFLRLGFVTLAYALVAAVFVGLLVLLWDAPVIWSERSLFELIWSGYLTAAVGVAMVLVCAACAARQLGALRLKFIGDAALPR